MSLLPVELPTVEMIETAAAPWYVPHVERACRDDFRDELGPEGEQRHYGDSVGAFVRIAVGSGDHDEL